MHQLFIISVLNLRTMLEIEVKILNIDRIQVEDSLVKMSATKTFDSDLETIFYDFADGAIVRANNVLRLRKENNEVFLTYKNVIGTKDAKVAEEYSVTVSDLSMMSRILEVLGLKSIASIRKHRISYQIKQTRFDIEQYLDKYSYVPAFVEIESDSIAVIHKYAEALGFRAEDCLPWSTQQVIDHYSSSGKRHDH